MSKQTFVNFHVPPAHYMHNPYQVRVYRVESYISWETKEAYETWLEWNKNTAHVLIEQDHAPTGGRSLSPNNEPAGCVSADNQVDSTQDAISDEKEIDYPHRHGEYPLCHYQGEYFDIGGSE